VCQNQLVVAGVGTGAKQVGFSPGLCLFAGDGFGRPLELTTGRHGFARWADAVRRKNRLDSVGGAHLPRNLIFEITLASIPPPPSPRTLPLRRHRQSSRRTASPATVVRHPRAASRSTDSISPPATLRHGSELFGSYALARCLQWLHLDPAARCRVHHLCINERSGSCRGTHHTHVER
jgi:hypothetical protein